MQNTNFPFMAPSSSCISEDLLFFDTFSHSGSEKDNFDLVQFPSPVVIDLIKIIPLGQPIEAKIPGSVRLGATNPSNCELEFFINDLTKQDAHTMTDLGRFYCSEKETDFSPPLQIQTDGLLLRGSYRTLTLAIFGQIATYDEKVEDEQMMMSASSPPAQTPASPVASERDMPFIVRSVDQELLYRARDDVESYDEPTSKSVELKEGSYDIAEAVDDAIMDINDQSNTSNHHTTSRDNRAVILDELSNSEGGPSMNYNTTRGTKKDEDIEYSNSTDHEMRRSTRDDFVKNDSEQFEPNEDTGNHASEDEDNDIDDIEVTEWTFNPETYNLEASLYFPDPSLTPQERSILLHRSKSADPTYCETTEKEIEKVKEMFEVLSGTDDSRSDDWVTLIEDLTNDIANMSLSQTISSEDMLQFLLKQVLDGLDYDLALRQKQTGFKVRHLRAGIKLATILFHCGESASAALLQASVPQKVLKLYNKNQMSLPLRLLILKCLSAVCDNVNGVEHMINEKYSWDDTETLIRDIKKQLSSKPAQDQDQTLDTSTKLETSLGNDNEESQTSKLAPETKLQISPRRSSLDRSSSLDIQHIDGLRNIQSSSCYQYLILILLTSPATRTTIAIGSLVKKMRLYISFKNLLPSSERANLDDSEDNVFEQDGNHSSKNNFNLEQTVLVMQDIVHLVKDNCVNIAQPIRHLPARVQFQIRPNATDTYLAVYRWMRHFETLQQLTILCTSLQSCAIDIMSPTDVEQATRIQNLSLAFIHQILGSPRGSQFFLSEGCAGATAQLLQTLANIQPPKRSSHVRLSDGIENCLSASLCREEAMAALSCRDTSLKMAYNFKVLSCIDRLFHFHRELLSKRGSELCDPERILHQLYILSGHPYGLNSLVTHLSSIGNLDCLLRFLDVPDNHKHLEFVKETSVDYALEIVGTFFRLNNSVLEIAEEYLDTLMDLCKTKEKNLSVRIKSLIPWLNPFESDHPFPLITYTEETFRQLTRVIRKSIPDCSIPFAKALDFELPPQMITAVRILRQLCIPTQVESFISGNFDPYSTQKYISNQAKSPTFSSFVEGLPNNQSLNQQWNLNLQLSRQNAINGLCEDSITDSINQITNTFKLFQPYEESICGELKYHYGIMQIFEQDGLKRLLNTLRELTGNYPRPVYQSAALSGFRGRIVISYINSVVILIHSIVCHLIDARGSDFKDTSPIPVILETYSLLCFVPKPNVEPMLTGDVSSLQSSITIRSDNYNLAQQTKKLILSILMSYTQMCLSVSESEQKVISKSMWTKMLKEVIEFTVSTPVFFHHGLSVLTQLLPSPLPGSSMMDSIDQEQLFKNINHRKLWSAHLHPLHQQIEQLISSLSICYHSNIRMLLYYLCNQLCDLSSTAACMVAKTITDTLLSYASKFKHQNSVSSNDMGPQDLPQQHKTEGDKTKSQTSDGVEESAYAIKMILNLLSNLTTNQAFETAFSNHLQALMRKDEKLLLNLHSTFRLHDDYKPGEQIEEALNAPGGNNPASQGSASAVHLIDAIKSMNGSLMKDGTIVEVTPPEELTKINLISVAHRTADRFQLSTSLSKTYRLKVLLDMNSRAHRSNETSAGAVSSSSKRFDHSTALYAYPSTSSSASHKAYVQPPPPRSRARPTSRGDMFRSRPQNTSRPPSIHVDDFIDMYGNSPSHSSPNRFPGASKPPIHDYRNSAASRGYPDGQVQGPQVQGDPWHPYYGLQNPMGPPGSPYSGSVGSSRSQHAKSKYMKSR